MFVCLDTEEDRISKSPTPPPKRPKTPTPVKRRARESAGLVVSMHIRTCCIYISVYVCVVLE